MTTYKRAIRDYPPSPPPVPKARGTVSAGDEDRIVFTAPPTPHGMLLAFNVPIYLCS